MTTDGSMPTASSRLVTDVITIDEDTTVRARAFKNGKPVGPSGTASFRIQPEYYSASAVEGLVQGLAYGMNESPVTSVRGLVFDFLVGEVKEGVSATVTHKVAGLDENYVLIFNGLVEVPDDGIYQFVLHSDDGSVLRIDGHVVVDHDGLHGPSSKSGLVALKKGKHAIRVAYFQAGGGQVLRLAMAKQGEDPKELTVSQLSHAGD